MKECKKFQNHFMETLYNELDSEILKALEVHLQKCSQCRKEFDQMKNTIKQIKKNDVPDPGKQYWDSYWSNLDQRMEEENIQTKRKSDSNNIFSMHTNIRTWTIRILSAAAMLLIGIGIGYLYFNNPESGSPINGQIPVQTAAYNQGVRAPSPSPTPYMQSTSTLSFDFFSSSRSMYDLMNFI